MKDSQKVTRRQFAALVFTSLLSPLLRVLPNASAALAGKAAWLCFLPAVPVLWAMIAFNAALLRRAPADEGLGTLILTGLGPAAGRALLGLYSLWFLLYAGFLLRSGGDRIISTVYPSSDPDLFSTALLLVCLLAALGTLRSTARTSVLMRAFLLAALAAVFFSSVRNMKPGNLLPVTLEDALPVLEGSWPILNVAGIASQLGFLAGYLPAGRRSRSLLPWAAVLLAVSAALCATVVGTFGPALTLRIRYPFFVMIRDVQLLNFVERIEAVVIAMWVFADFILCTVLLRCSFEALRTLFSLPHPEEQPLFCFRSGRWLFLAEAAAVWAAQHFLAPEDAALKLWSEVVIPATGACFSFGFIPLVWLVGKLRKKW